PRSSPTGASGSRRWASPTTQGPKRPPSRPASGNGPPRREPSPGWRWPRPSSASTGCSAAIAKAAPQGCRLPTFGLVRPYASSFAQRLAARAGAFLAGALAALAGADFAGAAFRAGALAGALAALAGAFLAGAFAAAVL